MNKLRRFIAAGFLGTGLVIFAASSASAQTTTYNAADTALPGGVLSTTGARVVVPTPAVTGQVLSLQASQPVPLATGGQASVSGLAFTGSDVITLLLIAVPLIAVGMALTRQARPRHSSQG